MSLFQQNAEEQLLADDSINENKIFNEFFNVFDPELAILKLREARDIIVKQKFSGRPYSMDEEYERYFFEKLEQLMNAAWLLKDE